MQQELLGKAPSSRLRVYAVWFNMVATDDRSRWPADQLNDRRVVHLWDGQKLMGWWYGRHPDYLNSDRICWDAYMLYGASSRWDKKPSHLVSWGRPIKKQGEQLRTALLGLLGK